MLCWDLVLNIYYLWLMWSRVQFGNQGTWTVIPQLLFHYTLYFRYIISKFGTSNLHIVWSCFQAVMKTAIILGKVFSFNAYSATIGSSYLFSCALHRELVHIPHVLWNEWQCFRNLFTVSILDWVSFFYSNTELDTCIIQSILTIVFTALSHL